MERKKNKECCLTIGQLVKKLSKYKDKSSKVFANPSFALPVIGVKKYEKGRIILILSD